MRSRPAPFTQERRALTTLLWALGAVGLLVFSILGASRGEADAVIALIPAALVGIVLLARPEVGVMALTSTFFLPVPESLERIGPFNIYEILSAVLAAMLLARLAIERRLDILKSRQVQCICLLLLTMWVNTIFNDRTVPFGRLAPSSWEDQPIRTLSRDLDSTDLRFRYAFLCSMYVVFCVAFVRRRWQILLLIGLVVSFVLMTSPNAIWHALTSEGAFDETRASATFGIAAARNANRLAFFCVLAITFIGYAMQGLKSRPVTLLGAPVIVMLVVTIFLSASRSGFLNLGLLSLLFLYRTGLTRGRIVGLMLVLLVAGVAVLTLVPESHLERITAFFATDRAVDSTGSSGGSNLARMEMLRVGLRMFADNPLLGVGIGNSRWLAIVEYGGLRISGLHNSYVTALVEGGLVLMAAYLLLFWSILASLARTRRLAAVSPGLQLGWVVEATWTSFLLLLVFSAFADVWHEISLFLLTALSVTLERLYRREAAIVPAARELAAA